MTEMFGHMTDFRTFVREFGRYARRRLRKNWVRFETTKSAIVSLLVAKRGLYTRPFLHTGLFMLIVIGIVVAPIIRNTYEANAEGIDEFQAPSAVLSSFDEQDTLTQISEKPRDSVVSYTVEAGDTISTIAEKFGVSADTIRWANAAIKGDKVTAGDELTIPPVTGLVLKVQKGETVYSIAKKYKTEAQSIVNFPFNDFADLDTFALTAGQTLVVPDGVAPEAKPVYSPRLIAQVGTGTSVAGSGQFMWPTNGSISQRPVSYHMAVDIANRGLPAIQAADGGSVILVEYARYGYGYHVIIDHGNGYQTLYGHMSEIYVSSGQSIGKGAVIGKMGSTGRSTGPHLHFEVRKSGALLNPLNFLN